MVKLDIKAVVLFLFRMGPAIFFVLFMMLLFFSFRVDVRGNSMERFVFELSDEITSDRTLTNDKSLFSAEKLNAIDAQDIEQYAQNCDFGYQLDIDSRTGPTVCTADNECAGFCSSTCGLANLDFGITGNCNCNLEIARNDFCECRKPGREWQDTYKWRLGYVPKDTIATASSEFPAAISLGNTALPANMRITAYESFLTRVSCASAKAYYLKEKFSLNFATNQLPTSTTSFKRAGGGTHVCLYSGTGPLEGQCRYLPNVPVEELNILGTLLATSETANKVNWRLTAYPLKSGATCTELRSSTTAIVGKTDTVSKVLLCMEPR